MKQINVIAASGVKVPLENQPNVFIGDDKAVTVDDSLYYRRRLSDGDLIVVTETDKPQKRGKK